MGFIDEKELLRCLRGSKRVLLIEPPYTRQYIPLGLAKIASYVKAHGGEVVHSRGFLPGFNLICITTVFTNDSKIVLDTIRGCRYNVFGGSTPIVVGGIFASIMPDYILEKAPYIDLFQGFSEVLDSYIPDYSVDWQIDGFFKDAMTLFTTRGCPNSCAYCMVWRMESNAVRPVKNWKKNIEQVDREICLISDNNFLNASLEFIKEVIDALNKHKKKIIFNNGVDCQMINAETAKLLSSLTYVRQGFRSAFDKMSQDGHFQKAMQEMKNAGFDLNGNSFIYTLYNFNDTVQEALYRMNESIKFGALPYMIRYRPLNQLTKQNTFIGRYWTKPLLKLMANYSSTYAFKNRTFEEYIKNKDFLKRQKIKLTSEDMDKLHYRK